MESVAKGKFSPQLLVVALLSVTLAACGGGGGGGSGSSKPPSSSSSGGTSGGGASSGSGGGANTPPQITSLEIAPLEAYTDSALTASLEFSDDDGDALESSYEWYLNGVKIAGETGSGLSADHFVKGDRVKVVATVSDSATDAVAEAEVEIRNSAPAVELSADTPVATNRTATLRGSAKDSDDEPLTYRWKQLSGESVALEYPDKLVTTFTTPRAFGPLVFQLTATDPEGLASSREIVVDVESSPPAIHDISLAPQPAYTDTALTATVKASDPDSQPLAIGFRWYVNDQEIPDATTATLPPEHFRKGDRVQVEVEVSDGALKTSGTESINISDSPASFTVFAVPETVQYGVPTSFTASAEDPDGDQFEVYFTTRPNGMEIDEEGAVTWTPTGPMFDTFQDIRWELALEQDGEVTTTGGTIRILDEDRLPPLARSGIVLSYNAGHSIASGDFNGDGTRELLLTDLQERLYTLAYDGSGYVQNWMYPYVLPDDGGKISSIAAGDIDGDGRDEMLVGLTTYVDPDPATRILIIDGQSRRLRDFIDLAGETVTAIRVDEVDNDGRPEIIALLNVEGYSAGDHRVLVYNGEDLSQAWQSPALASQSDMAVGDTDGDGTREIVLSGGYVFGYSGTAFHNEWLFADGFGYRIDAADLDGDGDDEIVGRLDNLDRQLAVYDANSESLLAQTGRNISDISLVDPDGDGQFEIAAFPLYGTTLRLYSFDEGAAIPLSTDWEFDLPASVAEGFIADTDGDEKPEFVAITEHNAQLVIAGQNPDPEIEWLNDDIYEIAQAYLGGAQANFNGTGNKLVFLTNASSRVPEFSSGMRAVQMDPRTGSLTWSRSLTGYGNNWLTGTLSDQGQDGTIELFYTDDKTPAMYSFFSDSIVWRAPEMNAGGKVVAAGHLNDDGSEDFVVVTEEGNIHAYDPKNQVLLWGIDRDRSEEVAVMDLDGDQRNQLVVRDYDSISVYLPGDGGASLQYTQTPASLAAALVAAGLLGPENSFRVENGQFRTVAIGDLDHDGEQEIALSTPYNYEDSWLIILNCDLTPRSIARTGGSIDKMLVQNYGAGHRNILALFREDVFFQARGVFREIDPYTGNTVSTSPSILPRTRFNKSMQLVDTDGDGIPELSYGTSYSMNVTR